MKPSRVLVLDADQRSALAITRSLGKLDGVTVFTSDATPTALAGSSRYSRAYSQLPDPVSEPRKFLVALEKLVETFEIGFLLPVTEVSCRLLLENSDRFSQCILPFPDHETVLAVSDKNHLTKVALEKGIPVPATRYFNKLEEWDYSTESHFPVVIKPALSKQYDGSCWISTAVRVANNRDELECVVKEEPYLANSAFMVQEFIPGHGEGVFVLFDQGRPRCCFSHQRLREKPPSGGVSVLSQAKSVDATLQRYTEVLLEHFQWTGVAMVEFRVTEDNKAYLMEINTRFWGSLQLGIDAGVNFPAELYYLYTGSPSSHSTSYDTETRLRWYLGDLDSLYLFLRDSNRTMSEKLKRIAGFLAFHRHTRHEIFRGDDWSPALHELRSYLRALFGV